MNHALGWDASVNGFFKLYTAEKKRDRSDGTVRLLLWIRMFRFEVNRLLCAYLFVIHSNEKRSYERRVACMLLRDTRWAERGVTILKTQHFMLFIYCLFDDTISSSGYNYSIKWWNFWYVMNCRGYEGRSSHNLRECSDNYLEELKKNHEEPIRIAGLRAKI
jgi:hypothetical protein